MAPTGAARVGATVIFLASLRLAQCASKRDLADAGGATRTPERNSESTGHVRQHLCLSRNACRALYVFTSINPVIAFLCNDYSHRICVMGGPPDQMPQSPVSRVYRTIFYFAQLKPRLMFAGGAALRALQLTTPFKFVFDPQAGVGAGLNLLSLLCASRWPAMLVLGWSLSKTMWLFLGAKPPPRSPVPVTVAVVRSPETGMEEVIPISVAIRTRVWGSGLSRGGDEQ